MGEEDVKNILKGRTNKVEKMKMNLTKKTIKGMICKYTSVTLCVPFGSRGAKKIISLDARAGAILEISYKMLISETLRGEGGTSGV